MQSLCCENWLVLCKMNENFHIIYADLNAPTLDEHGRMEDGTMLRTFAHGRRDAIRKSMLIHWPSGQMDFISMSFLSIRNLFQSNLFLQLQSLNSWQFINVSINRLTFEHNTLTTTTSFVFCACWLIHLNTELPHIRKLSASIPSHLNQNTKQKQIAHNFYSIFMANKYA